MRLFFLLTLSLLAGCGGSVAPDGVSPLVDSGPAPRDGDVIAPADGSTPGEPPPSPGAGLQYNGSVRTTAIPPAVARELSAPLFPDSIVFQRFQNASLYPAMPRADVLKMIDDHVKTFEQLLVLCAPSTPKIKLWAPGDPPLTLAEIRTNYDAVARCGYEKYGAKPYWVPQMVLDVDVCSRKLGADWHTPADSEVAAFTEADFKLFADTLTAVPGSDWFPVEWYYRLEVYVRYAGTLGLGNLAPGATHVSPLPSKATSSMNELYLGEGRPIGIRCLRDAP